MATLESAAAIKGFMMTRGCGTELGTQQSVDEKKNMHICMMGGGIVWR